MANIVDLSPEENPYDIGDYFVGAGGGQIIWEILAIFDDSVLATTKSGEEKIFYYDQIERIEH